MAFAIGDFGSMSAVTAVDNTLIRAWAFSGLESYTEYTLKVLLSG